MLTKVNLLRKLSLRIACGTDFILPGVAVGVGESIKSLKKYVERSVLLVRRDGISNSVST